MQPAAGHGCRPATAHPGLDPSGTAGTERENRTPSSSPQALAAPALEKNTSHEKVLKAFIISAQLPPYAALQDLHS